VDVNWSPDGNSIVFGSLFVPGTPIYTMELNTKQVTALPGSVGLFSPRWSPDGKHIAAITTDSASKLMIFDFVTQKWAEAFGSGTGYPSWSNDGKYIYFLSSVSSPPPEHDSILRLRLSDHKVETLVDLKNVGRLTTGTITGWFGLAPDESPLFARDISSTELYALDVQWP